MPSLQARDTFYECVEAAGVTYTVDAPIPAACKSARAAYDKACKASWVKHFDLLQVCGSQSGLWDVQDGQQLQGCMGTCRCMSLLVLACAAELLPTLHLPCAGQAAALPADSAFQHCQADTDRRGQPAGQGSELVNLRHRTQL